MIERARALARARSRERVHVWQPSSGGRRHRYSCQRYERALEVAADTRSPRSDRFLCSPHGRTQSLRRLLMSVSSETLRSISTPEQLETRLGRLEFVDGFP